jgi:5'(3')-deoxyribonucleotidase
MKKIVYVDMDNVLVDFPHALEREPAHIKDEYENREDEIPGIFSRMPPIPGAIESFAELAERFDTYVLSTAPWENPSAWSDKLLWVKEHLGDSAYKRLILTHHKNLNVGDYLIDDRKKNGASDFGGRHLLFGAAPYADWPAVMEYLRRNEP